MARFKKGWSDDAHAEFDALVDEVLSVDVSNADRGRIFADRVAGAVQAHRYWARDIERAAKATGFQNLWRAATRRGTVKVLLNGREVEKPAQISVKRENSRGQRFQQLAFFDQLSLVQVKEKRIEQRVMRASYDDNIATLDKVEMFIVSAGVTSVPEAEDIHGMKLDTWLARKVA